MVYETRKAAEAACIYEANAAKHYSKVAIEYAQRGECRKAWDMADTARTAARCALQAHEDLWALAGETLTDEESDAFEKAEIAQADATKAERAAAAAVDQIMREARN